MESLAFKRHLVPYVVDDEAVYLVSERGVTALHGDLTSALVPLLDGSRGADDIVRELAPRFPEERVRSALERLVLAGRVACVAAEVDREQAAYWELGGLHGDEALARLATCVRVETYGGVSRDSVVDALHAAGLAVGEGGAPLDVVLVDDYLRPELEQRNVAALASQRPWLLARPVGAVVWVGPLFRPGETGCWQCLAHRLSANRQALTYLQGRLGRRDPLAASAQLPLTVELGARLVALEAARFVAGIPPATAAVTTFDTLAFTQERHELVRRPQCPSCGDALLQTRAGRRPIVFGSVRKTYTADGGHRAKTPDEVLETYGRQVSPITGVVTALKRFEDAPPLVKAYTAGQNLARESRTLGALRTGLRSLSCGKGMSDVQARASALCEAIERNSGVFQGDEERITASFRELGDEAIHPDACLLYSEKQYRERATWNAGGSSLNRVSDPFDDDLRVEWSPVWSVTQQRPRLLPTSYLYYGYPHPDGRFLPLADSNGNAAGASLEDAVLQGFLELVERDSVALWWYSRVRRPAIDLDSFGISYVDELRETYAELGREVWALDLTADFGIPAVAALSRRTDRDVEDILFAFGAHLDPRIALLRALTEMNQFLPAVIHSVGDGRDGYAVLEPDQLRWWSTATIANQPYLLPADEPARTPVSWRYTPTDDVADDLALVQRLVEARGLELLVLDQTRPDVGLPVAKVIVPGMRHFWARFAPGRLYEVPVELGWLPARLDEEELNPIPIFI